MEDKKRGAAEVGTICDTRPNESINIIAHALAQGKSAVYMRRDGWTMMPQLPQEEGEYLLLVKGYHSDVGGEMPPYYWAEHVFHLGNRYYHGPIFKKAIAWMKLPEIPAWAEEVAAEQ